MPEIPRRPSASKEIILAAAQIVAAKINADAETIAQHFRPHMDGYDLAKELDKWAGWDTTRDEMESLDEVGHLVDEAVRDAEKAWFAENDIQPPFPVGTRIKEGMITGIYDYSPASYLVKEDGCLDDSRHRIIRFENAVAA